MRDRCKSCETDLAVSLGSRWHEVAREPLVLTPVSSIESSESQHLQYEKARITGSDCALSPTLSCYAQLTLMPLHPFSSAL